MPIYSNVYLDFHTNWLQNYYAGSEVNWPEAVLYAYIAEPVGNGAGRGAERFGP